MKARWMALALTASGMLFLGGPARAQVGISGVLGHWNTPSAEVLRDGELEFGYNIIPERWAWDHRGQYRNDIYFASVGFLPRIEVSARVSAIPGFLAFGQIDPQSRYADADRMFSAKIQLVRHSSLAPDVTVGLEDFFGTRRFHTGYVVAGKDFEARGIRLRVDAGYAGRVLRTASPVTLDGAFIGADLRPVRWFGVVAEYDTEKWNLGFKVRAPFGITGRAAWLNGQQLSAGAGMSIQL